jgi:Skp family chaperone for outer membrane proteins
MLILFPACAQNRAATTMPNHHAAASFPTTAAAVVSVQRRQVPSPVSTAELAEAKQELEKEREEKQKMQGCIQTLQEELSHAMRELKRLQARDDEDDEAKVIDLQVDDDIKFVEEDEKKQRQSSQAMGRESADEYNNNIITGDGGEVQKKRYVTFADPATADVVLELHRAPSSQPHYYREPRFQRQMSAGHEPSAAVKEAEEEGRKKKKKPLIPLVGALFMRRKKSNRHDDSF